MGKSRKFDRKDCIYESIFSMKKHFLSYKTHLETKRAEIMPVVSGALVNHSDDFVRFSALQLTG